MQLPHNQFKQQLKADQVQYGFWLGLSERYSAEICAGAGFDWLLIDAEHGPNDLRSILTQLQAIAPYDSHPIVRPPYGDHVLIKQLLETGVQTLLIPMVETQQQASDLVKAMRYPPHGIRGVGSSLARASRWGRIHDYTELAHTEMCLIVQVETKLGFENLDSIMAVDGVDAIFFGAADLAASYGLLGQPNHPSIVEMIETGLKKVQTEGKSGGVLCGERELVERYKRAGANFVAVGVDSMLLASSTSALCAHFKKNAALESPDLSY